VISSAGSSREITTFVLYLYCHNFELSFPSRKNNPAHDDDFAYLFFALTTVLVDDVFVVGYEEFPA